MSRKRFSGLAALVVTVLALLGLAAVAQGQSAKIIRVKGSNVMASLVDGWSKEFSTKNPDINVVVHGGGTAIGFEALFDKSADLVMASRKITEKELQAAALSGTKTVDTELSSEPIAIITHPSNPVSNLSLEQLRKIFTGEFTRWSEVGGPDEPILVIVTQPDSGTSTFLRQAMLDNDYFSSDAKTKNYFLDIIKEISTKKPPAIGFAGLVDATKAAKNNAIKIIKVKKADDSPAVMPSLDTTKSGSYPLVQPLYFYWDSQRTPDHLKKFIDFCKTK